jgi:hypothetical protein
MTTHPALMAMLEVNLPAMTREAVDALTRHSDPAVREAAENELDRRSDCAHDRDVDLDPESRGTRGRCETCGALVVDFGEGWESGWID